MRLIDADLLKQNCKITGEFDNNFQCVDLITLGTVIDNQPTAYDVDKVIEQLENAKMNFIGMGTLQSAYFDKGIDKSIEIVKGGGISESD